MEAVGLYNKYLTGICCSEEHWTLLEWNFAIFYLLCGCGKTFLCKLEYPYKYKGVKTSQDSKFKDCKVVITYT